MNVVKVGCNLNHQPSACGEHAMASVLCAGGRLNASPEAKQSLVGLELAGRYNACSQTDLWAV
jgi:hypothetical protein